MAKKTLYVQIGEDDLGIIFADPDDLKSEIGCLVRLPLNEMKIIEEAK